MKNQFCIAFFILLCYSMQAQKDITLSPNPFHNIKGINEIVVRMTNSNDHLPTKNEIVNNFFIMGNGQYIVSYKMFKNKPLTRTIYKYDNGQLSSKRCTASWPTASKSPDSLWSKLIPFSEVKYTYTQNQLTQRKSTDLSSFLTDKTTITNYTYNNSGSIEQEVIKNNWETNKKVYQYANQTTTIKYYREKKLTGIETIKKDSEGNIIEKVLKAPNNKMLKKITTKYNDKHQLIEKKEKTNGWNGFGELVGQYNPNKEFHTYHHTYSYNELGNVAVKTEYFENGTFEKKTYEYRK